MNARYIGKAILFLLLSAAGAISVVGLAAAQKIKLGSSLSPPSLDSISPYVGVEKGFFKKYGLDVEIVEFRGDVIHEKALLSGDIDLSINGGATQGIVSASKKAPAAFSVRLVTPATRTASLPASTALRRAWPIAPHPTMPIDFIRRLLSLVSFACQSL
ncbi:hypothetical protein EPO44_17770 [bacterium]|nr:MAG: hypothetical protein EPO44_17770 [bacterium]